MIDEFIYLLRRLARDNLTQSETEALRQKLFVLLSQGRDAIDSLNNAAVVTGLNADLLDGQHGAYYRDADKLDGQHGSYYLDASNLNAGTLSTDRFSAYSDLVAESKIGLQTGQVAPGDHVHEDSSSGGGDVYFWIDGAVEAAEGVAYQVMPRDAVIVAVYLFCQQTGTSGTTVVDIHKNGTTIFTAQSNRPSLAYDDADGVASGTPDVTGVNAGDVLRLDIDSAAVGAARLAVVIALGYTSVVPPVQQLYFAKEGRVEAQIGALRIYNRTGRRRTIQGVYLSVTTAPTEDDLIVDVNKNGTSLFQEANRPRVQAGQYSGQSTSLLDYVWDEGDYLTADIDQAGGAYGGDNLVITVVYY